MTLRIRLKPCIDRARCGQGDSIYREENVACY